MTATLKQTEALPESYPAVDGVTGDALAAAWQRIEHHIAWRFTPRDVVWYVETDGGEWQAPLAPVVTISVQTAGNAPYEPERGPMGGWVLPCGPVTVTASVGGGAVPAVVSDAVRRYARLLAAGDAMPAGVTRFDSGAFSAAVRRDEINPAAAMVNSGAADLLRPYRRAPWAS